MHHLFLSPTAGTTTKLTLSTHHTTITANPPNLSQATSELGQSRLRTLWKTLREEGQDSSPHGAEFHFGRACVSESERERMASCVPRGEDCLGSLNLSQSPGYQ